MNLKPLFLLACCCLLSQAQAQTTFDQAQLDRYFDALEQNQRFMGSVALSQNGQIIYTRSLGFADQSRQTKANAQTQYRIGSISKTFTAVLVFKAIEQKKLKLNQTLDKFFPNIPKAKKISIKQLLGHRSGIPSFTDQLTYLTWHTQAQSPEALVERIASLGSAFEPDSKSQYSNSNYVLLGLILEKVSKKSYAQLLAEQIVQPLGLSHTRVGSKINSQENQAQSYRFEGEWKMESETDMSVPLGAGALISTASDLVKFGDALFAGRLLKASSLKQMQTLQDDYGLGLFSFPFDDQVGYGHTGGIDGFSSFLIHFPKAKISYSFVCNGSRMDNNNISIAVLSAVFGKPYKIPSFKKVELNAEALTAYTGVYASKQMPLKITVSSNGKSLSAQATGQGAFPLEVTDEHRFEFEQAGVVLIFNPSERSMTLEQHGQTFLFQKE